MHSNSVFHTKLERRLDFLDGTLESPQEYCHKSRQTLRSPLQQERDPCTPSQLEMRPKPLHLLQTISRSPSNTTSGLTYFRQLQIFLENNVPSLEEHQVQHSNSRKPPCTPNHLEMKADSLALTEKVSQISTSTSRGGFPQQ